jgi:L-cysteate sulfo-lyase
LGLDALIQPEYHMLLSQFSRIILGHFPTPFEPMPRVTAHIGGAKMFHVKRDDATGLAGGGNKVRKLEYLFGDALAKGADTIITQGAVQSNHVRQTVAAASKLGLKCRAILERRIQNTNERFEKTGNVFLNHLLGIESLRFVAAGTDMNAEMEAEANRVKAQGGTPYIIPGGGSNAIGALGYVHAALELVAQANERSQRIDHVIVTSGSSGTHAGLVAGFAAINANVKITGISIRQPQAVQHAKVVDETNKITDLLGIPAVKPQQVIVNSDYVGGGYGINTEAMFEATALAAQTEGLLLDPVYTGKCFAGMIGMARKGQFGADEHVVFFHTGGAFGLFAYEDEFYHYLEKNAQKAA